MASAFWKKDKRNGHRCLVAKWRDPTAPRGWVVERRPNDPTREQAKRYAQEMELRASRVARGLEIEADATTFGALLEWWWERHGARRRGEAKDAYKAFLDRHLAQLSSFVLLPGTAGRFADALDRLLNEKSSSLGPQSLNHIRAGAHRVFECARDPKARLWAGENPVRWVERRKVPKRAYSTLRRHEVHPVLAAMAEPSLGKPWRWAAAICLYTGARPGEAMGLHKDDVDQEAWTITIRRSWTTPWPKDDEPRTVLVVPELRPHLLAAMAASPNHLVMPREDGTPFGPSTRFNLVDHLRRACARAGVVVGWDHTCRRCKAEARRTGELLEHTRRHPDSAQRECERCGMKLWAKPIPRPLRFYDLRHTHATLLRRAGVGVGTVQKALGHSSPEITAGTYDHSELEDFRAAIEGALALEHRGAPEVRGAEGGKSKAPDSRL